MKQDEMRGIRDGFLEYSTPSDIDYREVLRNGLVVVDTNVLLNLYRYHPTTRQDLLQILDALGPRLFIPHQVACEFWKNRESTIRVSAEDTAQLKSLLSGECSQSIQSLETWANRVALPGGSLDELGRSLRIAYDELAARVDEYSQENLRLEALDTNTDPVLERLATVLGGRVGQPLSPEELDVARGEAERRIAAEEPPGFADSDKMGDARYGDYFLWKELLREATTRRSDVLLVTGDVKEDWWRREKGETRGPRLELSRELASTTGGRLFMLRPANLLARAKDALDLSINEESVRAAETLDRLAVGRERRGSSAGGGFSLEKLPAGRSGGYLETLIDMTELAQGSPTIDDYVAQFQENFPSITLKEVARRRMRILVSLGLAAIQDERIVLSEHGRQLLDDRTLDVVQDCFMRRIAGASEIEELAASTSLTKLRRQLRDDPPDGLSSTQALLVLRYMEQLDLV